MPKPPLLNNMNNTKQDVGKAADLLTKLSPKPLLIDSTFTARMKARLH